MLVICLEPVRACICRKLEERQCIYRNIIHIPNPAALCEAGQDHWRWRPSPIKYLLFHRPMSCSRPSGREGPLSTLSAGGRPGSFWSPSVHFFTGTGTPSAMLPYLPQAAVHRLSAALSAKNFPSVSARFSFSKGSTLL